MPMFLVLLVIVLRLALTDSHEKNEWVEPHAWGGRTSNEIHSQDSVHEKNNLLSCPETQSPQHDSAVSIYYKKLINFIFNRSKMEIDSSTNLHSLTIQFKINSDDLKMLEKSNDPRDWDAVLSNILPKSTIIRKPLEHRINNSIFSFIKSCFSFLDTSEVRFSLILIAMVIVLRYFHLKHKYGIIAIVIFGSFAYGFIHTYYDCNREQEIQELINLMETNEDPCQSYQAKKSWFWSWFSHRATKEDCIEYLKKKNKIKLPFCRPDQVLLTYANEVILNQFRLIVEKTTIILKDVINKMPFPYNIVAIVMFALILPLFLKLVFEHIIHVFIKISMNYGTKESTCPNKTCSEHIDRLSGENLRILIERIAIKEDKASGVQMIEGSSILYQHQETQSEVEVKEIASTKEDETKSIQKSEIDFENSSINQIEITKVETEIETQILDLRN